MKIDALALDLAITDLTRQELEEGRVEDVVELDVVATVLTPRSMGIEDVEDELLSRV